MKRIDPYIVALIFIIALGLCLLFFIFDVETTRSDTYKNIRTKLIIKSRAEKLTESEFIQLSDSDKLTVLNNYQK